MSYTTELRAQIRFIEDIEFVIDRMIAMDAEIGDIWKWPDSKSCLYYALTEACEFVEAYLFATRPEDSRNNKIAADFNATTELFDTAMMLLRSAVGEDSKISLAESKDIFMENLVNYVKTEYIKLDMDTVENLYTNSSHLLVKDVCEIIDSFFVFGYKGIGYETLLKIYFSEAFANTSFRDIAIQKLDKILAKNLTKKESLSKE